MLLDLDDSFDPDDSDMNGDTTAKVLDHLDNVLQAPMSNEVEFTVFHQALFGRLQIFKKQNRARTQVKQTEPVPNQFDDAEDETQQPK